MAKHRNKKRPQHQPAGGASKGKQSETRGSRQTGDSGHSFLLHGACVVTCLSLLGLLCYSQVILTAPFLFDDNLFIERNRFVHTLDFVPEIFTTSTTEGAFVPSNFYRPMQSLLHAVLCTLFGITPLPHHLASVLTHIVNSVLLFYLLIHFGCSRMASLCGAVLFVVHPVQVEAVSYISGASDPLGLMFILSGFLLFLTALYRKRSWCYPIAILCFTTALFSKETASVTVALLAAYTIFAWKKLSSGGKRKALLMTVAVGILCVSYVVMRFTVLNFTGNFGLTGADNVYTRHLHIRLITFIHSIAEYARILLFPFHMYFEKPYVAYTHLLSIKGLLGLMITGMTVTGVWFSLHRRRTVFFACAWIFACLAPVSGIVPLNAMYLDHWLYLPFAGLALLVAQGLDQMTKRLNGRLVASIVLVCLALFCARTVVRNTDWSDIVRFYLHELRYNDESARIHNNLAMEYEERGEQQNAVKHYLRAVDLHDIYPQTHHNLAQLLIKQGKIDESIRELFRGLKLDSGFVHSYKTLSEIYRTRQDLQRARICKEFVSRIEQGGTVNYDEVTRRLMGLQSNQ